jgi:hypothetical protein
VSDENEITTKETSFGEKKIKFKEPKPPTEKPHDEKLIHSIEEKQETIYPEMKTEFKEPKSNRRDIRRKFRTS